MSILNSKLKLCNLELSNRLVMPPMASSCASESGAVTQKLCEYYREKSHGGYMGLVIVEHAYVSIEGKAHKAQLSIAADADVPGLRRLAGAIHANGSKVFAQISHAGSAAQSKTGGDIISASAVRSPFAKPDAQCPRAMTAAEIKKLIADFGAAAVRAREAGFDGVELHSAHYYLLDQFYSPLTNRRADEYCGSSLEGRLRLHLEIIDEIRRLAGADFHLALRLGACDYTAGGTSLEDSVQAAKMLEKAGLDLLDISGGLCGPFRSQIKHEGYFKELSTAIRQAISIPMILTGGITTAAGAEALLSDGAADLIGVGRALLKDSDWAENALKKFEN